MEISKTFVFQKIAFNGTRKINTPEVEMTLKEENGKPVLSICGSIWNSKHTDIVCGGQCLDEMKRFLNKDELFNKLYRLWKFWHLNDMCPGTECQENALIAKFNKIPDYDTACEYLKSVNLYEDDGYKYGTKWLYRAIPEDDLKIIKNLLTK